MDLLALIIGIVILVFVIIDLMYTTLAPIGAGILTASVCRATWKMLYYICGRNGKNKFLNLSGMITMVTVLVIWFILIWIGNTLIFMADESSVVHNLTRINATPIEKLYFTGYTLSTLGYGDFTPSTPFWKIYAAGVSFSGLVLLSLAISYLLPVLNADIEKRKLSIFIASMGTSPQNILINAWNGKDFSDLDHHFSQLASEIMKHSQNHLAYPVLHYFHSASPNENATVSIASLDEALTILYIYVPKEVWPNMYNTMILRKALTQYLRTLGSAFIKKADDVPDLPDLNSLKENKIPVINIADKTKGSYANIEERRKLVLGMLKDDGWDWNAFEEEYYSDKLTLS